MHAIPTIVAVSLVRVRDTHGLCFANRQRMPKLPFAGLDRGERVKAALLSAWFFLATATLWMLKSSRVSQLLVHLGARETPRVRLAGMIAVAFAVVVY